MPLREVRTFMYQLQNLEDPLAVKQLARSDYDLLIVEPSNSLKGQEKFDAKAMVAELHAGKPGRVVLAYLDACQAESFRTYWQADWKKPTRAGAGNPSFIFAPDPDGWDNDFGAKFWDPRWQQIVADGRSSQVHEAMAAGFDGVYLDWIDAYDDEGFVAEANKDGIDPARAMVDFLLLIRKTARERNPNALLVQQNATGLIDADPRLTTAIDAIGVEDTWFSGKANARWGSKTAGDVPNRSRDESSTRARLVQYQKFIKAGKPVLTIDYCVKQANADLVYAEAAKQHLIPLVTQVSLDRMTATPPPKK